MNYINIILNILISIMIVLIGYEDNKNFKITNKNLIILFLLNIIYASVNGFVINSLVSFFVFFMIGFVLSLFPIQMGSGDLKYLSLMVMYPQTIVHKYYFIIVSLILFLIYFIIKRIFPVIIYSYKENHKLGMAIYLGFKCIIGKSLPMAPALSLGYLVYIWVFSYI